MIKKKIIAFLLAFVLTFSTNSPYLVYAEDSPVTIESPAQEATTETMDMETEEIDTSEKATETETTEIVEEESEELATEESTETTQTEETTESIDTTEEEEEIVPQTTIVENKDATSESSEETTETKKEELDSTSITTDYITDNLDENLVKEAEETSKENEETDLDKVNVSSSDQQDNNGLTETCHQIRVSTTLCAPEEEDCDSIDEVYGRAKDECANIYANFVEYASLYEMEGVDDAYVAFLDFGNKNQTTKKLIGVDFYTGDEYTPITQDDITYDENTGIVYVPKYHYFDENGEEMYYDLKCQVMSSIDLENAQSTIPATVENETDVETTFTNADLEIDPLDVTMTIPLVKEEDADKIELSDIDIYLNDHLTPMSYVEGESAIYNQETGELTISGSAINYYSLRFVIHEKTLVSKIQNFFSIKTNAGEKYIKDADDMNMYPINKKYGFYWSGTGSGCIENVERGTYYNYTGRIHYDKSLTYKGGGANNECVQVWRDAGHYVYAPHLPAVTGSEESNTIRRFFYNQIKKGFPIGKIVTLMKKQYKGKKYKKYSNGKISDLYYNTNETMYNVWDLTPPSGTLKGSNNKKVNWGSLDHIWTRNSNSNSSYSPKCNGANRYRIPAMCAHGAQSVGGPAKSYDHVPLRVVVLNKKQTKEKTDYGDLKGYMVLGLLAGSEKSKEQESCAVIKVPVYENTHTPDYKVEWLEKSKSMSQTLSLKKLDKKTDEPLQGAIFKITNPDGSTTRVTTNSNGNASWSYTTTVKITKDETLYGYLVSVTDCTPEQKENFLKKYKGRIFAGKGKIAKAKAAIKNALDKRIEKQNLTYTVEEETAPIGYIPDPQPRTASYVGPGKAAAGDVVWRNKSTNVIIDKKGNIFYNDEPTPDEKTPEFEKVYGYAFAYHKVSLFKQNPQGAPLANTKFTISRSPSSANEGSAELVGLLYNSYNGTTDQGYAVGFTDHPKDPNMFKSIDDDDRADSIDVMTNTAGRNTAYYIYQVYSPIPICYVTDWKDYADKHAEGIAKINSEYHQHFVLGNTIFETKPEAQDMANGNAVAALAGIGFEYGLQEIGKAPGYQIDDSEKHPKLLKDLASSRYVDDANEPLTKQQIKKQAKKDFKKDVKDYSGQDISLP